MRLPLAPSLLLTVACATHVPVPGPLHVVQGRAAEAHHTVAPKRDHGFGADVANSAAFYLNHRPRGFRDDCSGFVCAAFTRAGSPVEGNARSLWDRARTTSATHRRNVPRPGDIAFFDNTYDRNSNGRWDDELTHVAVVLEVDADGTVLLAHAGTSRGRTTLTMNLRHPDVHRDDQGKLLNDYLRRRSNRDPKAARYLSGELWRGFAAFDPKDLRD